jgi:hypothetical protein
MLKMAKKFDRWLHSHLFLLLALGLLIALRIPNFFEPYWYGDEGIYLTIGNAIRNGERLYTEIVDHKTPIIYFLAAVPTQLCFRLLTLGWMIVSTIAFYAVANKLLKKQLPVIISTFIFVFLTSVPWLEGNIPNGELFVMGFVLVGAWIMFKTKIFEYFLNQRKSFSGVHDKFKLYLVGIFFGLAILTKVPGLFDVVAWLAIFWFLLTNKVNLLSSQKSKWLKLLKETLLHLLIVMLGVITPLIISIIYFVSIGSGQDYLQFGLLYNFHYAANWSLPFQNKILEQFFTLPGKVIIAALIYLALTLKSKRFEPKDQLIFGWFILSLVGALLSNRPYPHYFQQLVPALSLLLGNLILMIKFKKKNRYPISMSLILLILSIGALKLLNFGAYPMVSYYQRFFQLVSGKITKQDYRQSFNHFMKDNYEAAEIINSSGVDEMFIWGTNPMLYALTETNPTGRFTVSFHIKDLGVYKETMRSVEAKKPLFIVIMDDEHEELPGLNDYLQKHYVLNSNFTNFSLWKRLPELVSLGTL